MTGDTAAASHRQHQARPSLRMVAWTLVRVLASVAALVAVYYALPLDHSSTPTAVTMLVIGLVGFVALVAFHVRTIVRSPFPTLRGIEALAINVTLFLLLFASTYVVMAATSSSNFGARLSHTDGVYFTVTVFATVGFGDITAKTQTARLVVTGQMIGDLIVLGLAIKIIFGAVQRGHQRNIAPASGIGAPNEPEETP